MPEKRARRKVTTLREAIASFLEVSGLGHRSRQNQVWEAWCEAVGPETAKHTRLARIIRRGVLTAEVDSSGLLAELSGFHKGRILDVLHEKVRRIHIADIRFKLGSGF